MYYLYGNLIPGDTYYEHSVLVLKLGVTGTNPTLSQ
jgi:hypothetical protein